jgi:ABC-2 type transport system ATP-binding protein
VAAIALCVQDVGYTYPRAVAPALVDVSLELSRGEFYGLLGPNGAGKSTLIQLICGLRVPGSGRVELFGEKSDSREARRNIGVCPQEIALFPTLTAVENLRLFGFMARLAPPELESGIEATLVAIGLTESASRPVGTFSGGMKRRLNLGVAMLHRPRLLLLDEPTVGVDPQSRRLIFENLVALAEGGTTILYTTHYMEEAERLCGKIAIIDGGRILLTGSPEGLTASEGVRCTRIELDADVPPGLIRELTARGLTVRMTDETSFEIVAAVDDLFERLLAPVRASGRSIRSFTERRTTLEDRFLELTGHGLRDG